MLLALHEEHPVMEHEIHESFVEESWRPAEQRAQVPDVEQIRQLLI